MHLNGEKHELGKAFWREKEHSELSVAVCTLQYPRRRERGTGLAFMGGRIWRLFFQPQSYNLEGESIAIRKLLGNS